MAARSRYFRCAWLVISFAAAAGMTPSSACDCARAASTSSHDWNRACSVNSARTPGSSIRSEVGSSSMGALSQVRVQKPSCLVEALRRGMLLVAGMGAYGEAMAGAGVIREGTGVAERSHPALHPTHALDRRLFVFCAVQDQGRNLHTLHEVVRLRARLSV